MCESTPTKTASLRSKERNVPSSLLSNLSRTDIHPCVILSYLTGMHVHIWHTEPETMGSVGKLWVRGKGCKDRCWREEQSRCYVVSVTSPLSISGPLTTLDRTGLFISVTWVNIQTSFVCLFAGKEKHLVQK